MVSMRRNIIAVKTRPGEVRFFAVASIERVEAFGNYVKIYFGNERVLHRATLSVWKTYWTIGSFVFIEAT